MLSFVELRPFTARLPGRLSDEAYRLLQLHLIERPEAGAVMKRTGGWRKVRWADRGRGKSGGVRVVYLYRAASGRVYLADIYAKNEKDTLSRAEEDALRDLTGLLH